MHTYEVKCPTCGVVVGMVENSEIETDPLLKKICAEHAPPVTDPHPPSPPPFTPDHGAVGTSITLARCSTTMTVDFDGVPAENPRDVAGDLVVDVPVGAETGPLNLTPPGVSTYSLGLFTVE